MYASPFDAERFPEASAIPEPVHISAEAATVLQQLRSTRPNPLDWNTATPIEKSTALARAIFDHEAARLTLDLPDDRMDLPVALHMDDPRLLQLLDTARQIQQRHPAEWPMLMDMALEAVQAETADVMGLDVDGLDARDLDNQNMPLYETIHEDMLDHRLETRYQGILNPGTLAAPVTTPWMPPAPGTYLGVLPVRPSPLPNPSPQEVITPPAEPWTLAGTPSARMPSAGVPPAGMPESPTFLAQPQPQPQRQRSATMPDYQIREVTDPETQAVTYRAMMVGIPENRGTLSRIWASTAQNDELPVGEFASQAAAQEHIRWLQSDEMNGLREQIRQAQPVTIAGVPYEPILNDDGGLSHYIVSDSLQRTDMPLIAPWELQQYLHTGTLSPEMATQQWQNAASAGYEIAATERAALQRFAREADADPQFHRYHAQEADYLVYLGGSREDARKFSLADLPASMQTFVRENRFATDPAVASNAQVASQPLSGPVERLTDSDQIQGRVLRQESPASARTLQATATETGLHLQDLYLPDAHRKPMRIDTAFRESDFIRAFFNTPDALSFMGWVDAQKEQRAALDRGEPLTLGQLRYVPAGVPGEYRATDAETGQPIDRQIIDQSSLYDLLHNGVVRDDLAQQWQLCPDLLTPILQTIVDHRQKGMYDYASVADEISRYAPIGIAASPQTPPVQPVSSSPQNPPASPAQASAQPSPAAGNFAPSAAERQAQVPAANPQDMDYKDEATAGAAAPAEQNVAGETKTTPVEQEKTQEAQQDGREGQQKDRTSQQGNQAENDGQNQKGQGQGTSSNAPGQDAPKSGGFSLFSRVHQHHHYTEEKPAAPVATEAFESAATPPGATPSQGATPPEVSKRETMGVLNGMNQVPLSPEEINVMRHRVEKEGLTPEIQKGIENLSARGQQDVKDGKLTPEQIQKNAHAMNQLGDTVNRQPDSPQKDSVLEHIRKLVGMLVEALKRIFSRGRASAGPGMGI